MSATLYCEPVQKDFSSLPDELMFALRKRFSLGLDGYVFGYSEIQYLQALADQEIDGATKLMDLIEQHGKVRVFQN